MTLAESTLHTLDPYAIQFGHGFGIRWYGLSYAVGFLIGWLLLSWMARTRRLLMTPIQLGDFVTYVIVGVIVGGRLGHTLFYEPSLLTRFGGSFPWWGLLEIHKGGMSSHGGIIGVVLACWLFSRRRGIPFLHLLDCAGFAAPIGLGLGRMANWVNGELWGKPLPVSMWSDPPWWSVKDPKEILSPTFSHLSELRAIRADGLVSSSAPFPDSIVDAIYHGNQAVISRVTPLLTPHWPNQFMQAITDGVLVMTVLVIVWLKPRRPGVITGWFFIAYGVLRMATESMRIPDEHVFTLGPLTLPMILSLGMIALGIGFIIFSMWRGAPPLGGLLKPAPRAPGTPAPPSPTPAPKA